MHVCMCVCMYVCLYARMYVCMYLCINVCITSLLSESHANDRFEQYVNRIELTSIAKIVQIGENVQAFSSAYIT